MRSAIAMISALRLRRAATRRRAADSWRGSSRRSVTAVLGDLAEGVKRLPRDAARIGGPSFVAGCVAAVRVLLFEHGAAGGAEASRDLLKIICGINLDTQVIES